MRVGEAADDADGHLIGLFGVVWGLAELAGGDFDVLLGEGVGNVKGREFPGGEFFGVEPDAHGVLALAEDDDRADAGDALEGVGDVDVEVVGDEGLREGVIGGDEAGGEDEVRVGLSDGDAGVVDGGWEAALGGGDAVLDVYGGDVEVVTGLEGDGDCACAVVGAGGGDVAHSLDTVDGLFEGDGDCGFNDGGVGTDVVAGHDDLRGSQLGVERDRDRGDGDCAGEDDEQGADGGEDGTADEEIDQGTAFPGIRDRDQGSGRAKTLLRWRVLGLAAGL